MLSLIAVEITLASPVPPVMHALSGVLAKLDLLANSQTLPKDSTIVMLT
jgi:hypothetical protein